MNSQTPTRVKIAIDVPADSPTPTETMWAFSLGEGIYELDNTPWFATGIALGDIVKCEEKENELPKFLEVVERSGNWTVRIFVPEDPNRDAIKKEILDLLKNLGCLYEGYGPNSGLIAVTIPADRKADPILDKFRELQASGKLYWESGNF